ncbi:MAG: DUF4302 domain-containing protein [Carboxylicivirga sp.]|jgi:hypothetical protein|nr:DUF4302 domain-containing protein [Carboxylicivirga sp.]
MSRLHILFAGLFLLIFTGACDNSDFENKFDLSPDERLQERMATFKEALTAPEHGWVFHLDMGNGVDNTVYGIAKFNEDYTVRMENEIIPEAESEYTIFAEADIELVFNTYNKIITFFAEPNPNLPKGSGTDLEYNLKTIEDDQIILEGKVLGTRLRLTKATETETSLEPLKQNVTYLNQQRTARYMSLRITKGLGASEDQPKYIGMDCSTYLRMAEIDYNHDGEYVDVNKNIFFTHKGFGLSSAIKIDGEEIQYFKYNADEKRYEVDHPTIEGYIFCDVLPYYFKKGLYDDFMDRYSMKLTRTFGKAWNKYIPMKRANENIKAVVITTDYDRRIPKLDEKGNYIISPDTRLPDYSYGDHLGEGLLFSLKDDLQFYFYWVPLEAVKIEEDRVQFIRKDGEFCTEDDKDPSIGQSIKDNKEFQEFVDFICNDKGWMLRRTEEYGTIDYDFYSLADPNDYFYSRLY